MTTNIIFRSYRPQDKEDCLSIFDANCPKFFAVNERADYANFLDLFPPEYEVCILNKIIIGAYGLVGENKEWSNLNWILISPNVQGKGIGSKFIQRVINKEKKTKLLGIKIAASHLSAPFFKKYGAIPIQEIKNGWGIDMHRIDMELKFCQNPK